MVLDYYKLREEPFGVTPDSRFLYASATHREALASLLYAVETRRGFAALIAKPGMGKTTLLFEMLRRLREKARTVFLFQTISTPVEFLQALLTDLGVHETGGGLVELHSKLNEVLAEYSSSGKPLVLAIDEAQNLNGPVLELIRMLSNFETSREKLMQIVLAGQPQLAEKLLSPELMQLRQRISIVSSLEPFSPDETALLIEHRLRTAGYLSETPLFSKPALALIAQSSEGIPRNINNFCFNALSLGCALKQQPIDCEIVREVIADLDLRSLLGTTSLAAPPEEKAARPAPTFVSRHRPQQPIRRLAKIAVGAVAVAVLTAAALFAGARLSGLRLRSDRPAPAKASAWTAVTPPLVALSLPPYHAPAGPARIAPANSIRVAPGETLYGICMRNLGSYDARVLEEIHRLNPRLSNPDHVESGETIRIPAREPSGAAQDIAEQPVYALAGERGSH